MTYVALGLVCAGAMAIGWAACTHGRIAPPAGKEALLTDNPETIRASPPPSRSSGPSMALNYSRDIGWSGSMYMEVQREGESTVVTSFNDGSQEIGSWRAVVPAERFDELIARLRASGYERLAPAGTTFQPGTKFVTFGERRGDEKAPVLYSFATVPPELGPIMALLEETKRRARAHPLRVLRGSAQWVKADVSSGDEVAADITLTNVGVQQLEISNPLHDFGDPRRDRGGWNGLRWVFAEEGVPGQKQYDLTAEDVVAPPDASRVEICVLEPGQSLRFEGHKKIDLRSGRYRSRVEYSSIANRDGDPDFVGGVLELDSGVLSLQKSGWWKLR